MITWTVEHQHQEQWSSELYFGGQLLNAARDSLNYAKPNINFFVDLFYSFLPGFFTSSHEQVVENVNVDMVIVIGTMA